MHFSFLLHLCLNYLEEIGFFFLIFLITVLFPPLTLPTPLYMSHAAKSADTILKCERTTELPRVRQSCPHRVGAKDL